MALHSKLRSLLLQRCRLFSTSILNPDSKTPLNSIEKSRSALSLIQFEKNPERILDICRAAALTPESHLDRVAYSRAISKLKESNYYEGIRSFINESLTRPDMKYERCVSHFVVLYGQSGLIKDAIKLFDEMPKIGVERSVKSLNALLFACVLAGEYGEMKRIFKDFPGRYGLSPNLDTYNTLLKGFSESGSSSSAYSILAEMESKGIIPNGKTFSTVIAGFYAEEKFDDVGKITELMKKHVKKGGFNHYNVRIQSLCKLKRSSEAKALFDSVLSKGMVPNWVTYNHLIYGFCREGNLDMAKSLFKEMTDSGLKPLGDCYYTLIYYLCQGKDYENGLNLCKDCMAKGWFPNITTMKSLVNGLVSIGKLEEAREIIGQLKEKFSRNADTWTEMEEGLSR